MINVTINDNDHSFRHGMECFLRIYFKKTLHQDVWFNYSITNDNVRDADIIIQPLKRGEQHLCAAQICLYSTALIICIADEENNQQTGLAECYRNAIWISRRVQIKELEIKLALARTRIIYKKEVLGKDICYKCRKKTVTEKQKLFLQLMKSGHSLDGIQKKMNIKYKTIHSFKQQIKTNFSLKTDNDMLQFYALIEQEKC
jgi:hypothetical protein